MMTDTKTTAFELWLREYGSHLEQLARPDNTGGPMQETPRGVATSARALNDPTHGQ